MSKNNKAVEKTGAAYYLSIAGVLTLICAAVALMLGFVNYMTKDVIALGEEKAKKAAVYEIFPEAEDVLSLEDDEAVFVVKENGVLAGYCVSLVTQGYGGDISLIVGVTNDQAVKDVKIVSMSETAGLGSKTQSPSFLDQFIGKSGKLTVGENIDAVSGATISSKAVTAGIERALEYPIDLKMVSEQTGIMFESENEEEDVTSNVETDEKPSSGETNTVYVSPVKMEKNHIDQSLVGANQSYRSYEKDKTYTYTKDTVGSYLEKETTDTESDTESEE